jgi:hypothetical protein
VNRRVLFLCLRPITRDKRDATARAQRPRSARHRLQRNNDLNFEVDEKQAHVFGRGVAVKLFAATEKPEVACLRLYLWRSWPFIGDFLAQAADGVEAPEKQNDPLPSKRWDL